MTVEQLFDEVATRLLEEDPSLGQGQMFNAIGLKTGGKFFAMVVKDELVLKLPADRIDQLIVDGEGRRFDPGHGRLMKEWATAAARRRGELHGLRRRGTRFRRLTDQGAWLGPSALCRTQSVTRRATSVTRKTCPSSASSTVSACGSPTDGERSPKPSVVSATKLK